MRKTLSVMFLILSIVGYIMGGKKPVTDQSNRLRNDFDSDWKFFKGNTREAQKSNFDDAGWRNIDLPHDWSIEGPFREDHPTGGSGGYVPTGVGWYRKHFYLPDKYRDKKVFIEFDGVYMNSDVWINDHHLGNHPYGYTSFYYDMTPYLNFGDKENVLAVKVDNSKQPDTRWYSGSGIYRHVWLLVTDPMYVKHWGTYITTPAVSGEFSRVVIRTRVKNEYSILKQPTLTTTILDESNKLTATVSTSHDIAELSEYEFIQSVKIERPNLWSLKTPYLYRAYSTIIDGNRVVDKYQTSFGIREINFDADNGFFLNRKNIKIKGVCLHHDGGCVGAAVPERVLERRLEILKEMGCNAIRMSHNPPSTEFLNMCDRMGFLVMDEAFDEWKIGKRKYGYYEYFNEWGIKDLISMLHRDRNHPGVIMWSVGNEIPEQDIPEGIDILKELVDICHREDPTRPVTSGCDHIVAEPAETIPGFLELLDVVGYNYVDRWRERRETYYSEDHFRFPNRKMIGSESISVGGVRGDYKLYNKDSLRRPYNTRMIRVEQLWKYIQTHDYVAGDFIWTGIDYLGEAKWPAKSTSFGVIDMCGFPKDGYYFYQSQWTDKPMIHIFPHWNWKGREGHIIPVICYTNCDSVEMFLNGRSYGIKCYEFPRQGTSKRWNNYARPKIHPTTADLHLSWDIPYEPGTLKAIGRKDGRIACIQEINTSGEPAKIVLKTDRDTIFADGKDVVHFTVQIVDSEGYFVPTADNLIYFDVEGEGKLIGVGNGNPECHEDLKANHRKAFNGLCLAIVQTTETPGKIRVTATSEGLNPATVSVNSIHQDRSKE